MSFWNLLCEAAALDMICKLFSPRRKTTVKPYEPVHEYTRNSEYEARIEELEREVSKLSAEYQNIIDNSVAGDINGINDLDGITDIDELQDRIDELESRLIDCDIMSDRYDRIQDEIYMLEDRLDELEDMQGADDLDDLEDMRYSDDFGYIDDIENDFDSFHEDFYDIDPCHDDW